MESFVAYSINVLLSWKPYLLFGVAIIVISNVTNFFLRKELTEIGFMRRMYQVVLWGWLLTLLMSVASGVNTFKLEQHDRVNLNKQIEIQNTTREHAPVVDNSRKPELNTEERKERFDSLVEPYWKNSSQ